MKKAKNARPADLPDNRPNSVNYYLYFTRASQKAGTLATRSFFQLRDLLNRDINLPTKQSFKEAISTLIPKQAQEKKPSKISPDNKANSKPKNKDDSEKKQETKKSSPAFDDRKEDLDEIIKRSNEVLAEATTVFPFTLFPDTVTVDRSKLIITQRTFFMTSKALTIHIEDVLNIAANVGPFFGSLTIAIKGLTSEDHFTINYFWRRDAIHLKHIIQGHIMAQHDRVDYRHLDKERLLKTLLELGRDAYS